MNETEKMTCCVCHKQVQFAYVWLNYEDIVCSPECYEEHINDRQR